MTLQQLIDNFHDALDNIYGQDEVRSMFYLLSEHYLNVSRVQFALEPKKDIDVSDSQKLLEAIELLKAQKPIQYIIGETEFYGLHFKVNQNTLIPRPETEELVDWIVQNFKDANSSLKILDIGTGSGCIAVALAKHLSTAEVYALDISQGALEIAKQNAKWNGVDITFIQKDILNSNHDEQHFGAFDIIVSNPPYVRHLEKVEMKANVLDNEPHSALFVDDDHPLEFYESICNYARQHLKPNGVLYFEINEYLGEEMITLLSRFQFKHVKLRKDLSAKDRMIKGIKS